MVDFVRNTHNIGSFWEVFLSERLEILDDLRKS